MITKNLAILAIAVLSPSLQGANDFIVQTDLETGLIQHIYVQGPDGIGESNGTTPAASPIGASGARLQLFGIGLDPDTKIYLLDETTVASYLPKATVATSSADPYLTVTRTRADQPFIANLSVENISNDPDTPEGGRKVYVERLVAEYPEGTDRLPLNGDPNMRLVESFFISKNGSLQASLSTSLSSTSSNKQKGEEYIRIYALPDSDLGWSLLDEKKVQVWPIADGQIQGSINGGSSTFQLHGKKLTDIPTLMMHVTDLYPTSMTYMNLYKGEKSDNAAGSLQLSDAIQADDYEPVAFNTIVPQAASQTINPSQWAEFAKEDGVYTVEILTVTPFNNGKPERLAYATFTLKRTLKINAHLVDSE